MCLLKQGNVTSYLCNLYAGSGNFLIIAYKELRKLEIEILKAQREVTAGAKDNLLGLGFDSVINLDNLYGIEYDDFASQIARLSLWLAEHQMNVLFEQEFGALHPMLPLKDSGHIVHGNSLRIDWNEVCPNNGTDEIYVIGNPPFGGKGSRSKEQNEDMQVVLNGFDNLGQLDYVTCWFWKGAQYIKNTKTKMALVSTNSVSQGIQVASLFPPIFDLEVEIEFAYQSFPWSNNAKNKAAVHVVIIGLSYKNNINKKTIFSLIGKEWHSEPVDNISPYLIKGSSISVVAAREPISNDTYNKSKMILGSMAKDGGNLILSNDDKIALLENQPKAIKWIRKIIGSDEFLNGKIRWCLWFEEDELDEALRTPFISDIIRNVETFRLNSKAKSTREYARIPHLFTQRAQPKSGSYIVAPMVTSERRKYVPIGFLSSEVIASNLVSIIPSGDLYTFGVITSEIHMDWMRLVGSRMEMRYRYSATLVYNTFPFPEANDEQKKHIEYLAEEILMARASNVGMTLAELYDPDKMPADLKQAHSNLDDAVDKLYRPQGFANTEERLAHLLARYEELVAAEEQAKKKK